MWREGEAVGVNWGGLITFRARPGPARAPRASGHRARPSQPPPLAESATRSSARFARPPSQPARPCSGKGAMLGRLGQAIKCLPRGRGEHTTHWLALRGRLQSGGARATAQAGAAGFRARLGSVAGTISSLEKLWFKAQLPVTKYLMASKESRPCAPGPTTGADSCAGIGPGPQLTAPHARGSFRGTAFRTSARAGIESSISHAIARAASAGSI